MEGVTAVNGGELIGINTNLGDKVCDRSVTLLGCVYTNNTDTGYLLQQLLPQDSVPGLQWL
jgi:hypothetical protein